MSGYTFKGGIADGAVVEVDGRRPLGEPAVWVSVDPLNRDKYGLLVTRREEPSWQRYNLVALRQYVVDGFVIDANELRRIGIEVGA